MFSRILVANRGLIQANCIRAIQELGAQAIAVYVPEDRNNAGIRNADEAYEVNSYADIDQIVTLAKTKNIDAVHPGYGFLAQNNEFVQKLQEQGITTIGPILKPGIDLSSKPVIKELVRKLGLPVLPSSKVCSSLEEVSQVAENEIKYPIVIKAAYGYGGKAIRYVNTNKELKASYEFVQMQCKKFAMNSTDVFVEKFLTTAFHIEFPVLRDQQGNVVVFPEQECSVQRRFRKYIIETPSKTITNDQRSKLETMVKTLVHQVNLVGFASVEFLIDNNQVYFLEINGYIQPSHTASSILTGVDLLKENIRICSGELISNLQDIMNKEGHVINVYITAEDTENNFIPCPGQIDRFCLPLGEGVIVQTDVSGGDTVSTFYDPMVVKIITFDNNRNNAIKKMQVALKTLFISGIKTNLPLMRAILASKEFQNNKIHVSLLEDPNNRNKLMKQFKTEEEEEIASILAALSLQHDSNKQQIMEAASCRNIHSAVWQKASRLFFK